MVPNRCAVHAIGIFEDFAVLFEQTPVAAVVVYVRITKPTDANRLVVLDFVGHPLPSVEVRLAFLKPFDHAIDDLLYRDIFFWQLRILDPVLVYCAAKFAPGYTQVPRCFCFISVCGV
jgi:hypothetical protein